jgi:catechol 2,3-dioxygenase-like lactoylglutathione lyase family enzyme
MTYVQPLIQNETLSHGTVECTDMVATRRFYVDFLGLDIHRPVREAQYIYRGGPWTVVCVCVDGDEGKDQPPDNHFKLTVDGSAEVKAAHAAAIEHADRYGIKKVADVSSEHGGTAFLMQDLNYTWWEITDVGQSHYDALFDAGDPVRT